jgi:hypothetical protein
MTKYFRRFSIRILALAGLVGVMAGLSMAQNPNDPGIEEPVTSQLTGTIVRIPNTDQASGTQLLNVVGPVGRHDALGSLSITGHTITRVSSPNDDMSLDLGQLADRAASGDTAGMRSAAEDLLSILLGTTQGRIYDGFAMLNFNRGAYVPDQVPGEYKMKVLRDTGGTEISPFDGKPHKVWEVDVNMLWYDGNFDSDTFLLRVPVGANEFDTVNAHFHIYSLVREDFAPTVVMQDRRMPGSVQFPFKGFDAVWVPVHNDEIADVTVKMPPVRLLRGVYTWGWRIHPPRIQFLQPIYEHVNAHTGQVELEPEGLSFAYRNRNLTLDGIGDAAPEKKMYNVCQAVLAGADPKTISSWLTSSNAGPLGTWQEWADLAKNQRQLPPEALNILAQEGIPAGQFGSYRFVTVYMNNEMYGAGPDGSEIEGWNQGDHFEVKLINLDNHTHYFRNVDFGPRLHDDIANCCTAGSHSFEIMNFKPTYGAPKVAEVQWRAGWGFRPHFDVIQQQDVFPRASDQVLLKSFTDGQGKTHLGWQYSAAVRGGDFRFNPPNPIIGTQDGSGNPSAFRLKESDGSDGLLVGQLTEGYGLAKMCSNTDFPLGGFCTTDISGFNPNGAKNVDTNGDGIPDVLWFPPFLRNPNPNGGDILPPTPAWKPFLYLNPHNGTLFIDPNDPSKGFWTDLTYAHGTPIAGGQSLNAHIEASRGSAHVFYQFDPLFHDNAIFSPHPTFSTQ